MKHFEYRNVSVI